MIKITSETIKEAAKSVDDLMTSASPEIKLLLENPHFAIGLCLVLHKEVAQLRNQFQESAANGGANEQQTQPVHAAKQINPRALEGQPISQNQPEQPAKSNIHLRSQPENTQPMNTSQAEKEELFV